MYQTILLITWLNFVIYKVDVSVRIPEYHKFVLSVNKMRGSETASQRGTKAESGQCDGWGGLLMAKDALELCSSPYRG
jgi:hypothetical protein